MALQSSGAISISDIKTELSSSSNSLRTLSSEAGFSTPDAMSEFYGYSAGPTLIYFDGTMMFSYTATAGTTYAFNATNFEPNIQDIYYVQGDGDFDISTDYTPWDRYFIDNFYETTANNIYIFHQADDSNVGSDYATVYITPPSGRSFGSITVSDYSITYTSVDYSSSNIFASYYANGSYGFAWHDVFFYVN